MPAGLAVGCASPIKNLLFGEDPPLEFLTESLNTMAAAMIPSMMLVLGSVLHKGPGSAKVPIKIILGVLGVRQILIPFLGATHMLYLGKGGGPCEALEACCLLISSKSIAMMLLAVLHVHIL